MSIRRRVLPRGWYPDEPESIRDLVHSWCEPRAEQEGGAIAAVAPHAGWAFSGRIAAASVYSLASSARAIVAAGRKPTIAVFGGHLPPGAPVLSAPESGFDTPLGPIDSDPELLAALENALLPHARANARTVSGRALGIDEEPDNTVEVLLPLIAALLPGISILWLRAPNDSYSIALGQALHSAAESIGRDLFCLGSTDLTHYGPNYGFSPKGRGASAETWVRNVNDKRFIDALLDLDAERALSLGEAERSACSSGGATAALSYARASGATRAELLEYATSLDVRADESFVGYAAIAFYRA